MKKQIRKAMLCTIAMMVAAILTLTGVTYAWFSESDEALFDGITMDLVGVDGGVYISTMPYPEEFDTSITIPEGTITGDHNPASTAGILSGGKLQFFTGTIEKPTDKTLNITSVSETGYYFEQDVYFDNSTGSKEITINLTGTEITPTDGKRTDLAVRIAVVTHGSITIQQFEDQVAYPTATESSAVQICEPNSTEHISKGITEYKNNIDPEAGSSSVYKYFGIKAVGNDVDRFKAGTNLVEMTTIKEYENVKIVVPAEQYLKTTIYVWLEGQDADCQNTISGKPYSVAINFALE